jgi:hypothetical protein
MPRAQSSPHRWRHAAIEATPGVQLAHVAGLTDPARMRSSWHAHIDSMITCGVAVRSGNPRHLALPPRTQSKRIEQ